MILIIIYVETVQGWNFTGVALHVKVRKGEIYIMWLVSSVKH